MHGKIIYQHQNEEETVLDKSLTFILNELLTAAYDFNMIDYSSPTCISIAPKIVNKWAIKTGTTDVDSWTIGYNNNLLMGWWTGYDDSKDLVSGDSKYSRNIWVDTTEKYLEGEKVEWYK